MMDVLPRRRLEAPAGYETSKTGDVIRQQRRGDAAGFLSPSCSRPATARRQPVQDRPGWAGEECDASPY